MSTSSPERPTILRSPRMQPEPRLLRCGVPDEEDRQRAENARVEQATEIAYRRGIEEGRDRARRELIERTNAVIADLNQTVDAVRDARERYLKSAEAEVVKLTLQLVARIIARQIDEHPTIPGDVLRQVLATVADQPEVSVRVSPEKLEALRALESELGSVTAARVRWVPDRRVPPSGVVVETEAGQLDATIEAQLDEAALLFDEVLNEREP